MLALIQKGEHKIRTAVIDGKNWFIAKDLGPPLGIANIWNKVKKLDPDEKGLQILETLGGEQEMTVLSEPGLLSLILSCPKSRKKDTGP